MQITVYPSKPRNNTVVSIGGHKHSFVQILSAAVILKRECTIHNVPKTDDVLILKQIIRNLGGVASFRNHKFYLNPKDIKYKVPSVDLCNKIHGALYFLFALAIRFHRFPLLDTGGCQIGKNKARPNDHLLEILNLFGKTEQLNDVEFSFQPYNKQNIRLNIMRFSDSYFRLSGEKISSATKLAILASLTNKYHKTVIKNPYIKTDVLDLLDFLAKDGHVVSSDKKHITITPKKTKHPANIAFTISDCQSEVFTFITLALVNNIKLILQVNSADNVNRILYNELEALRKMGINIQFQEHQIIIPNNQVIKSKNIVIKQNQIQSDHQPFFALLLLHGDKSATIREEVWQSRFEYAKELCKLGHKIDFDTGRITVHPTKRIKNNKRTVLCTTDTRAAAVLAIAAIKSGKQTVIKHFEHVNRGYEDFIKKLQQIGVNISQ